MGEAAYELLALGLRYWFILLVVLTIVRAVLLMWGDKRAWSKALRRLPDAGLVGEVVNLDTGKGQPLPREGLLGSGRNCDIRVPALRRREMEFVFRPGLGLKLIPLHRRQDALLDGEPLNPKDSFALHGTVLELRGIPLRFRLFAGLEVPQRLAPTQQHTEVSFEGDPWDYGAESGYIPYQQQPALQPVSQEPWAFAPEQPGIQPAEPGTQPMPPQQAPRDPWEAGQ